VKRRLSYAAVAVLLAGATGACGGSSKPKADPSSTAAAPSTPSAPSTSAKPVTVADDPAARAACSLITASQAERDKGTTLGKTKALTAEVQASSAALKAVDPALKQAGADGKPFLIEVWCNAHTVRVFDPAAVEVCRSLSEATQLRVTGDPNAEGGANMATDRALLSARKSSDRELHAIGAQHADLDGDKAAPQLRAWCTKNGLQS
jgi:hypothetical protein